AKTMLTPYRYSTTVELGNEHNADDSLQLPVSRTPIVDRHEPRTTPIRPRHRFDVVGRVRHVRLLRHRPHRLRLVPGGRGDGTAAACHGRVDPPRPAAVARPAGFAGPQAGSIGSFGVIAVAGGQVCYFNAV